MSIKGPRFKELSRFKEPNADDQFQVAVLKCVWFKELSRFKGQEGADQLVP